MLVSRVAEVARNGSAWLGLAHVHMHIQTSLRSTCQLFSPPVREATGACQGAHRLTDSHDNVSGTFSEGPACACAESYLMENASRQHRAVSKVLLPLYVQSDVPVKGINIIIVRDLSSVAHTKLRCLLGGKELARPDHVYALGRS